MSKFNPGLQTRVGTSRFVFLLLEMNPFKHCLAVVNSVCWCNFELLTVHVDVQYKGCQCFPRPVVGRHPSPPPLRK